MIPTFDKYGNLPPGIHEATIEEVVTRFSLPPSQRRKTRTEKLEEFYQLIHPYVLQFFVDGSYITNKLSPGDVDLLIVLKKDFDIKSEAGKALQRFRYDKKTTHMLHIFLFRDGHPDELFRFRYLFDYFQENDRVDPPVKKGIVSVRVEND